MEYWNNVIVKLRNSSYKLRVTSYELQVTSYKLQVASDKLGFIIAQSVGYRAKQGIGLDS